jgi:hypothetical protein
MSWLLRNHYDWNSGFHRISVPGVTSIDLGLERTEGRLCQLKKRKSSDFYLRCDMPA